MKDRFKIARFLTIFIASCSLLIAICAQAQNSLYTFTNLYSFSASGRVNNNTTNSDGVNPVAVVFYSNAVYGVTTFGGPLGNGAIFSVNADGTGFTNLHFFQALSAPSYFEGPNADGANPEGALVVGSNVLYGTCSAGGTGGTGAIFRINTDGTGFTNLHSFGATTGFPGTITNLDGGTPRAGLVLSGDTLYGTASAGGISGNGTIFSIHADGSGFLNLHTFSLGSNPSNTFNGLSNYDGAMPATALALSSNVLYGSTTRGGTNGNGSLFAINTDGTGFTNLHNSGSAGQLVIASGTILGTSNFIYSTIFRLGMDGSNYTNVYTLEPLTGDSEGYTLTDLTLSDGRLYGAAAYGGAIFNGAPTSGFGDVFSMNLDGTDFRVIYSSTNSTNGSMMSGKLSVSGTNCYGTSSTGGTGSGTVFHLSFLTPELVGSYFGTGSSLFRIAGPAASVILSFTPDGTLIWSNAQPGSVYTVQTLAVSGGQTNWVSYVQVFATNNLTTNRLADFNAPAGMVLIPAGMFMMGDSLDGETDAVPVSVTVSAFYMDTNLVTADLWHTVYNWAVLNGYQMFSYPGLGTNYPMNEINFYDAIVWCNARSQMSGLTPVYYEDQAMTMVLHGSGAGPVYANWPANGYRLPTEAEWEKAARGGLNGQRFPWGNFIAQAYANYCADSPTSFAYDFGPDGQSARFGNHASPVGSYPPNDYGLYDMAGNLFQMCWDSYAPVYAGGTDPHGPATFGTPVVRGGYFANGYFAPYDRCAYRGHFLAPNAVEGLGVGMAGFRCVRNYQEK